MKLNDMLSHLVYINSVISAFQVTMFGLYHIHICLDSIIYTYVWTLSYVFGVIAFVSVIVIILDYLFFWGRRYTCNFDESGVKHHKP